jgi:uncharacterized NAD(P)/FAD-binding protein YdhS
MSVLTHGNGSAPFLQSSDARMSKRSFCSVVIVGGGASGAILAAHLLRVGKPNLRVTLIEKRSALGQGVAYSTTLAEHVLNVAASRMSAYPDDADHFWRWLKERGIATGENSAIFVPRRFYGQYLGEILRGFMDGRSGVGRLRLIQDECLSILPTASGVDVRLANGTSVAGHLAVLAVGHDQHRSPSAPFAVRIGSEADTPIDPDSRVLILGTGLSMIDAWITLQSRGHRGEIVAVSRRGLLPLAHHAGRSPIALDRADVPLGTDFTYFVRWLRQLVRTTEQSGGDWRDVIDGLRPFNQLVWRSWPVSTRRRFLVHAKAWWDIHRHRISPTIRERFVGAQASGRLRTVAARLIDARPDKDSIIATLQPRRSQTTERLEVARIYDCTGIVKDVSAGSIGVIRSLIDRGLARPDPLRLGLDVTANCAVIDRNGTALDRIYAAGPLTRGRFFEIDAIPEIRVQCASIAKFLTASIDEAPNRESLTAAAR